MQALQAAGIPPSYDATREQQMQNRSIEGYKLNPKGFYEHFPTQLKQYAFSDSIADGQALKLQLQNVPALGTKHQVIFVMVHRDPAEIRTSIERGWPELKFDELYPDWPNCYDRLYSRARTVALDRRCVVELHELNFAKLIADPVHELSRLPINAANAAAVVQQELYRNRATCQ